jgi:ferredoxin-NADP reductase/ferredoxin
MLDRTLTLRVQRIVPLTPDISAFEFVHPRGLGLPGYAPGAHIDVHTPGGFMRQYSLAEAPPAHGAPDALPHRRQARGGQPRRLGGLARAGAVGDLLAVSAPRNTFALHAEASRHLLLAGGIGLTPLLAMAQQLARDGAEFTLCVFARSREHLAFGDALAALGDRVRLHFDDPAAPENSISRPCWPARRAARISTSAARPASCWPCSAPPRTGPTTRCTSSTSRPLKPPATTMPPEPFTLQLAQRGLSVEVAAGQSAVQALHELGIEVPTSCEQGICGTCVVGWHAGEPEHRDFCLSATERRSKVALCCSRAKSRTLTVDLLNTPYVNTITLDRQPPFPGDLEVERELSAHDALERAGDGGARQPLSASSAATSPATPRRPTCSRSASTTSSARTRRAGRRPGVLPAALGARRLRARLPRRPAERGRAARALPAGDHRPARRGRARGCRSGGLSHPWLMPDFWQFPTGSMGIGPISAIYQARFMRYLAAPRAAGHRRPQGLGLVRRRRDGRARVDERA